MTDGLVAVFLCEAGGLFVAVDCGDVHAIVANAGSEQERAFAGELFGRPLRAAAGTRTLVMRGSTGARVVVDRVLGMRSLSRADLRPLPSSVRALGAVDWVLGLTEIEDRIVWLIDLAWAALARSPGLP